MAEAHVSKELPVDQATAWNVLSDLSRYGDWLTIHDEWKSDLPAEISAGSRITEQLTVMGLTNTIEWTVDQYDAPNTLTISGTGMAGAQVSFTMSVASAAAGSTVSIDATFTGQMMVGAIGDAVEKNTTVELENSAAKLAEILG